MAVQQKAIDEYLNRRLRKLPDWKTEDIHYLNDVIKHRTGRLFKRTRGPQLYGHQFRSLAAAIYLDRSLLFLGPRLGKTRITLEWAQHLRNTGLWTGTGIILVPSPLVLDVWRDQISEYVDLSCTIVRTGEPDVLMKAIDDKTDLTVVAWSTLQTMFTNKRMVKKRGWDEAKPKLVADIQMLLDACKCYSLSAIDEIHMCKNKASLTFEIAQNMTLGHEFKLGLTGTPFDRNPFDVWAQATIIDQGETLGRNYYFFIRAFGKEKMGYMGRELVFDKKKLPLFGERLKQCSISYKMEEVRQVKEMKIITTVPMQGEQLNEYNSVLDAVRNPDALSGQGRTNIYMHLLQISSGLVPFMNEYGKRLVTILPAHAKLLWLREQIKQGTLAQPTIIFHRFINSGNSIVSELEAAGIKCSVLNGATKDRTLEVSKFQLGKTGVIVANYQSGSVAIDLSRADWTVYYEVAPSATLRMQAEKRAAGPARGTRALVHEELLASPMDIRALSMLNEGKANMDKGLHSNAKAFKALRA